MSAAEENAMRAEMLKFINERGWTARSNLGSLALEAFRAAWLACRRYQEREGGPG